MKRMKAQLMRLYRCERGAEGLEKLLIIGAVVLPLLGLLFLYRKEISEYAQQQWDDMRAEDTDFHDYAPN